MANSYLFTSESVSAGHPDKVADRITDAIVDSIFQTNGQLSNNRAAVETLVTENTTILAGEVKIPEKIEVPKEASTPVLAACFCSFRVFIGNLPKIP